MTCKACGCLEWHEMPSVGFSRNVCECKPRGITAGQFGASRPYKNFLIGLNVTNKPAPEYWDSLPTAWTSTNEGWICPKCEGVHSPIVRSCPNCKPKVQ